MIINDLKVKDIGSGLCIIEEAFDIQIPDAAAMEIATVQDAVDFIVEKKELELETK